MCFLLNGWAAKYHCGRCRDDKWKRQKKNKYFKFCNLLCQKTFTWKKSASFKLKPVCLPRSRCFIAPRSWCCCDDESDTQNKNKYLHLTTILFCPRSIMFYFYICLGQAAMSMLQGKIILSIKGSHDVYQEFILLLQTGSKLLLWLTDIWRCTYVTNSNFSFYSHITIIWHLTWEAWLQCSLSKLKKKDRKLVQMFSTNTTSSHSLEDLYISIMSHQELKWPTQVRLQSTLDFLLVKIDHYYTAFGLYIGQN